MHQQETNDAHAPQDLGYEDPTAELHSSETRPRVLARIPDLDPGGSRSEDRGSGKRRRRSARFDGRLISQSLSTRLLVGGGVLLVLAAVVPLLLPKSESPGGQPLAPEADMAPAFRVETAQNEHTPAAEHVVTPTVRLAPPEMNFQEDVAAAMELTAATPGPAMGVSPPTQGREDYRQGTPVPEAHDPTAMYDNHYETRRPGPRYSREYQPQAEQQAPQVDVNRRMSIGDRYNTPAEPPAADQPLSNQTLQVRQPGVARLEGIIAKPSVRTTHDRDRSSFH